MANATIDLYSGSLSGSPIATTTTDGSGNYSLTFTPSGSTPLFLVAKSGNNSLSSYIGNANSFSGTVKSTNNSNLNITQVTTASLAMIQNQGVSLSSLTPTTYGQQIIQLYNAIIQLAAVVQDVVDQTDRGCSLGSTSLSAGNLSTLLGSSISATTNVISTLSSKLSSCNTTTLNTLASEIPSNQTIAPQLTSTAATTSTTLSVPAGTYTGTVSPVMTSNNSSCSGPSAGETLGVTATLSSSGALSLAFSINGTSSGSTSGTLTGYNLSTTGKDGSGEPLSVSGAFYPLSSGSVSGGSGFSVNGSWTDGCSIGGSTGGTYNIPSMLSSGASLTATPSSVANGTYNVTIQPVTTYCANSTNCTSGSSITATVTIKGSAFSINAGSDGVGSGTLTGNTFSMTITNNGMVRRVLGWDPRSRSDMISGTKKGEDATKRLPPQQKTVNSLSKELP